MLPARPWITEEHLLFQDAAHSFFQRELTPNIDAWREARVVDRDFWRKAGSAGLLGPAVPEKLGGAGADVSELFFSEVRVPEGNLLGGEEGQGFVQLMGQLPWERLMLAVLADASMDPEYAGVHMLTSHRYEDLLSEHFAKELGLRANDPEPRLLAAMVQWGSFSVLRSMDDATANSEKATHDLYRRTFKVIQKVHDLFAENRQGSKNQSK